MDRPLPPLTCRWNKELGPVADVNLWTDPEERAKREKWIADEMDRCPVSLGPYPMNRPDDGWVTFCVSDDSVILLLKGREDLNLDLEFVPADEDAGLELGPDPKGNKVKVRFSKEMWCTTTKQWTFTKEWDEHIESK